MTEISGHAMRVAREQGVEVKLPSGFTVKIRPMGIDTFIRLGGFIPDFLTPAIVAAAGIGTGTLPTPTTYDEAKQWYQHVDSVVSASIVSPRVVADPKNDDEISIDDLTGDDKLAIYNYMGSPAKLLESFRRQSQGDVPPVAGVTGDASGAV